MASAREIQLAERRGVLKAKMEIQRQALAVHAEPVARALDKADRVADGARWLKQRPGIVATAAAVFVILKPRRTWRLGKRAFFLWQTWQTLRKRIPVVIE